MPKLRSKSNSSSSGPLLSSSKKSTCAGLMAGAGLPYRSYTVADSYERKVVEWFTARSRSALREFISSRCRGRTMVALGDRSAGRSVYWSVYFGALDALLAAMVNCRVLRVDTLTASSKYTVRVWSSRLRLKDAS